jgi:NodT family efflux transporter outer membrane factor (OMF) lipoprotein
MTNKIKYSFISLALLAALPACKIPRVATLPPATRLPEAYGATADTGNIALRAREIFFTDPHLQHVIADVLKGNPDVQIALQRIQIAGAHLRMSRGAFLPAVYGLAQASGTRYGEHTMEGVGNFDTNLSPNIDKDQRINTGITPDLWLGIGASWEVGLWGKLKNRKRAAQQRFWATEAAQRWVVSTLVSQAATAYYELVALDKEAAILKENIGLQEHALEIVKAQKEGGRATELAVIQFEAQLLETRSAQYVNQQRRTELGNLLNRLAGRYTGEIARKSDWPSEAFDRRLEAGIPAQLLEHRPDIREASLALEASRADARAARAAFFPSLNISLYAALNSFNPAAFLSLGSLGTQILGGLTAPIFQRHEIRSRFRIANAEQEQAFHQYQQRALIAYNEVADRMAELKNTRQALRLKQEQVTGLERGVTVANDLYLNGYANYLEIISAQKSKLQAQLDLINMQRQMVISMVGLYRAAGGGWQ